MPNILAELEESGGELEQEELFGRLEALMDERLTDADRGDHAGGRAAVAVRRPPGPPDADRRGRDGEGQAGRLVAGLKKTSARRS